MNNNIKLSIIIPSYLEEENLRIIIPRLKQELSKINEPYEILVIDTLNPLDDTKNVCINNSVKYLNREFGNNYADAIRTGIKTAQGEYVIFMDADGSHSPEFIHNLYKHKDSYDVVVASRYINGGNTDNSKILILMSLIVNMIYSLVLNIKCKDVSNSFKLYKTESLKNIKLFCNNFDVVEEILYKLKKMNKKLKIKEIPYSFKKRMFGETKRNLFAFIFSYIYTLIKLKFIK